MKNYVIFYCTVIMLKLRYFPNKTYFPKKDKKVRKTGIKMCKLEITVLCTECANVYTP